MTRPKMDARPFQNTETTWRGIAMRRQSVLLALTCLVGRCVANHYSTLGVARDSAADLIKKAYRNIALKHHPDKIPKSASAETRRSSQRVFEQANEAFEVLSDPAQRRQYDFELANPIKKGDDGVFRRGEPGAAPTRPIVEVKVTCGLEEMGGWAEAQISLDSWTAALGATVTEEAALRLGLPLRLYLPPGSSDGDVVRYTVRSLGPQGVDIAFKLSARKHRRWARKGNDLHGTVTLSAWHRLFPTSVRLRGVDGERTIVRPAGERVKRAKPTKVTLASRGMPIAGSGDNPRNAERGDMHVTLSVRSVGAEAALLVGRVGGAVGVGLVGRAAYWRVPLVAAAAADAAGLVFATVESFLSNEVFGRATPMARRSRARAKAARQAESYRRRSEREAARVREQRERRSRAFWQPIRRRLNEAWVWAFDS